MRVSFNSSGFYPQNFKGSGMLASQKAYDRKQKLMLIGDLGLSLSVGVAAGFAAAGIMRYKKMSNIFVNSLELGSIFSYLTYMGTLIATPFREK